MEVLIYLAPLALGLGLRFPQRKPASRSSIVDNGCRT